MRHSKACRGRFTRALWPALDLTWIAFWTPRPVVGTATAVDMLLRIRRTLAHVRWATACGTCSTYRAAHWTLIAARDGSARLRKLFTLDRRRPDRRVRRSLRASVTVATYATRLCPPCGHPPSDCPSRCCTSMHLALPSGRAHFGRGRGDDSWAADSSPFCSEPTCPVGARNGWRAIGGIILASARSRFDSRRSADSNRENEQRHRHPP